MKRASNLMLACFLAQIVMACSTTEKQRESAAPVSDDSGDDDKSGQSSGVVSANRVTLTNSWSNNPLTSQTINRGKADSEAQAIDGKDKRSLEGKASAMRLAGKSGSAMLAIAKKIAEVEMKKAPNKEIDAALKLEIALAAMTSKEFALALYFLEEIAADKKAPSRVRAGAFNAMGVIALKDDRIPEAVVEFRQSLKEDANYRPAKLNLAFTALKGGGLAMSKSLLGDMQNDWFVRYGLISVERMEGDTGKASEFCERVLDKESGHKAALFNCGLVEGQNKRNFAKAIDLVERANKAKGGEPGWDERIQSTERTLRQEQAEEKAKAQAASGAKDNKPDNPK